MQHTERQFPLPFARLSFGDTFPRSSMKTLAQWSKDMGWFQTEKRSLWGDKQEFVGLIEGYFFVITDCGDRMVIQLPFSTELQSRSDEIGRALKSQSKALRCSRVKAGFAGLTLFFEGFAILFQNKVEKVEHALATLVPLLRRLEVYPSGVCSCGSKEQLRLIFESGSTIHYRCPKCSVAS